MGPLQTPIKAREGRRGGGSHGEIRVRFAGRGVAVRGDFFVSVHGENQWPSMGSFPWPPSPLRHVGPVGVARGVPLTLGACQVELDASDMQIL